MPRKPLEKLEGEELVREAEKINDMKYDKARRDKAEILRKQLQKTDIICGAIRADNGRICNKPPVEGSARCAQHGGLSTGATSEEGKQRALANLHPKANLIHGLYSQFTMSTEEAVFYETYMNYYIEELDLDPINIMILDRALRNFIINQRKERAEANEELITGQFDVDYDTKFLKHLQALGLDRKFNVSKDHKDNQQAGDISMLFMGDE